MIHNKVVTSCFGCPLLGTGHTLYCKHPALKSEADAHIIHRDHMDTVPTKCPLRKEPLTRIITLEVGV